MSNQNDENTNSYNYNPNRPQSQNEIDHSSTKKVSDTAAKGAAEYLAPGVGGKIYDASKNVPGIGDAIDNATSNIAKTADKIPGVSKTTEALDKSGAVDAVNSGIDMIGGKPQGMNKGTKSTSSGIAPSATTTISQPYRKNMDFSHRMNEQEVLAENSETQSSDLSDTEDLQSAEMSTSDLQNDFIHDEDSPKNESQSQGNFDSFGNFRKSFKPIRFKIVIGSIFICFVFLLFLILLGGSANAVDFNAYSGCTDTFWWPLGVNEPNDSGVYTDEPTSYTSISSYFGYRDRPTEGASTYHQGIDIPAPEGTPIVSALDGTVTAVYDAADGGSCGNGLVVTHANGISTLYCHAVRVIAQVGDEVGQGTIIAEVGTTGASTGNHLHFSIMINGEKVDPLDYISTDSLRPTCTRTTADSILSLTTPSLARSDFISKMENYCESTGNSHFCTNFSNKAGNIYDWSLEYNVNPELVVVTAGREQGWKTCESGNYNFWGLGIPNGATCSAHVISSLEQGISELAQLYEKYTTGSYASSILNRYNERVEAGCDEGGYGLPGTFLGMLSIYSWLGTYRANPGSAGAGGCYYLKVIYGEDYAPCSASNTCASVNGGEGCTLTTVCEQSDYTKYGTQVTMDIWNNIFGG